MTSRDKPLWCIRAGRDARFVREFIDEGLIAIGGGRLVGISPETPDEELVKRFREANPDTSAGKEALWVGQLRRFLREMQVGHQALTYDPNIRVYFLGTIESGPQTREAPLANFRKVSWTHQVSRDALSTSARNSLGAIMTLFQPSPEAVAEVRSKAVPRGSEQPIQPSVKREDEDASGILLQEVVAKSADFVEDAIARLDWEEMQELVAGILRAMGLRTRVSRKGADLGVDIVASPDGLGLQEPRVFVEVKHRRGAMGAQDLRSFLGGRQAGDKCLYVSTGGFTKDAGYEAHRSNVPVTLIALPELRDLLVEHYENLDGATRTLVPLERLYWPASEPSGD